MLRQGVLLLLVVATAYAIVCPKGFCDRYECKELGDCEGRNGLVREKGGFCGCCDSCVVQLEEGEHCFDQVLVGVPPKTECKAGLICKSPEFICTKP
uniref:U80-Liphistoxin-Lsp1a_1 n=1 Tax=Liphistius sp. SGP-2016 TaxID=1905180 RepID=A0A4Q8K5G7_9ARAC